MDGAVDFGVVEHFQQLLSQEGSLDQVPILHSMAAMDHLPNHSLVRFRGMVQDMLNPEYYQGAVRDPASGIWRTSKYGDLQLPGSLGSAAGAGAAAAEASGYKLWERRPLYCIPVPGQSGWAQPGPAPSPPSDTAQPPTADGGVGSRQKRSHSEVSDDIPVLGGGMDQDAAPAEGEAKEGVSFPHSGAASSPEATAAPATRSKSGAAATAEDSHSAVPAPTADVIVYLYGDKDTAALQDIVEVVGVISRLPELAAAHHQHQHQQRQGHAAPADAGSKDADMVEAGEGKEHAAVGANPQQQYTSSESMMGEEFEEEEFLAAHPPMSQAVRLHAILLTRNPTRPALSTAQPPSSADAAPGLPLAGLPALRAAAASVLAASLCGDGLAAEYVLMQLLAKVTSRSGPVAMGLLPLNIYRCPAGAAAPSHPTPALPSPPADSTAAATTAAAAAATAAATASATLPAGAETTTPPPPPPRGGDEPRSSATSQFAAGLHAAISCLVPLAAALPVSVDACNRLPWQPCRDHASNRICCSPLQLAVGTVLLLDETVMGAGQLDATGLRSLQSIATCVQEQVLCYDFSFFQQRIPVDLPAIVLSCGRSLLHNCLPLQLPLQPTSLVRTPALTADLPAVRAYLAAARSLEYQLTEGSLEFLSARFVRARKVDPAFGPEQFHLWLTMARLCAVSFGECGLSPERWSYLMELENRRQARIRVI
ncbi:MAG: hypothetical protein WDW38_002727 [Sanguina aurantia]